MIKVTNISYGHHYLIHVFYKDLSGAEIHAYSDNMLNQKINEILNDSKVHDFYIYAGIDFDLKEE